MFFPCRSSIGLVLLLIFSSISVLGPGLHYLPGAAHHACGSRHQGACGRLHAHAVKLHVCHGGGSVTHAGASERDCGRNVDGDGSECCTGESDGFAIAVNSSVTSVSLGPHKTTGRAGERAEQDERRASAGVVEPQHDCAICRVLAKAQFHGDNRLDCSVTAQSSLNNQKAPAKPCHPPRRSHPPRAPPVL
jgi:hypothetical protein